MPNHKLRSLLLCLSILVVAGGCGAGRPTRSFSDLQKRLSAGNTVYVIDDTGTETKGKIVDVSATALTLDVDGLRRSMEQGKVRQVQRYGDSLWNGFFFGVAASAPGVLISDPPRGGSPQLGQRVLAIGIIGAFGAGIDALIRGRHPIYQAPAVKSGSQ